MSQRTVRYGLPGRKCPLCPCYFATSIDYLSHLETHWKKARSGNGEWIPAQAYPELAERIRVSGAAVMKGYKYILIDDKIIFRMRFPY